MRFFKISKKLKSAVTNNIAKFGDINFVAMKTTTLLKTIWKSTEPSCRSKIHRIAWKKASSFSDIRSWQMQNDRPFLSLIRISISTQTNWEEKTSILYLYLLGDGYYEVCVLFKNVALLHADEYLAQLSFQSSSSWIAFTHLTWVFVSDTLFQSLVFAVFICYKLEPRI